MLNGHDRLAELLVLIFDVILFAFKLLDFLSFPLARRLSSLTIAKNSFDSALLLLVLGLGSFSRFDQYTKHSLAAVVPIT